MNAGTCATCGGPIVRQATGRPAAYCSGRCRVAASRERVRRDGAARQAAEEADRQDRLAEDARHRVAPLWRKFEEVAYEATLAGNDLITERTLNGDGSPGAASKLAEWREVAARLAQITAAFTDAVAQASRGRVGSAVGGSSGDASARPVPRPSVLAAPVPVPAAEAPEDGNADGGIDNEQPPVYQTIDGMGPEWTVTQPAGPGGDFDVWRDGERVGTAFREGRTKGFTAHRASGGTVTGPKAVQGRHRTWIEAVKALALDYDVARNRQRNRPEIR